MTNAELMELGAVLSDLRSLRRVFDHTTTSKGEPLSDATIAFNQSLMKRIDGIIENVKAVANS